MEAVLELIWTGSYGSTTIDDICDKAKVRKGSFYYYFDSKADLAVEAIESQWQKVRAESVAKDGEIVSSIQISLFKATAYSPFR